MIKFFRRIRQQLLKENKFSKYLFYAIGEIILVVLGILIALNINNWNEYKKDRVIEKKVLNHLVVNIETNQRQLERNVKSIDKASKEGDEVIRILEERISYPDSLKRYIQGAIRETANFTLSKIGYDFFKEAGFGIVENDSLSKDITAFFENEFVKFHRNLNWEKAGVINKEKFIGEHFISKRNDDRIIHIAFNNDELIKNKYFYALLSKIKIQRIFFKSRMNDHIESSEKLLLALKAELKRIQ